MIRENLVSSNKSRFTFLKGLAIKEESEWTYGGSNNQSQKQLLRRTFNKKQAKDVYNQYIWLINIVNGMNDEQSGYYEFQWIVVCNKKLKAKQTNKLNVFQFYNLYFKKMICKCHWYENHWKFILK